MKKTYKKTLLNAFYTSFVIYIYLVLLNNINPRATKEIAEARQIITEEFGLKIFKSIVGGRKVFKTAFSEGKSVFETNTTKDTKSSIISAQEEVRSLINEIGRILNHGN